MDLTKEFRTALLRYRLKPTDVDPYCERVLRDYAQLVPHLPPNVTSLLDIGCGWGGHALYFAQHYGPDTQVNLIEGTKETPKEQSGFRETAKPYRNGSIAVRMLANSGVRVKLYPVNGKTQGLTIPSDLIVSLCSWLHHYSAETYLPLVLRSLNAGGFLLVDIRTGTDGIERLTKAGLKIISIVKEKPKFTRILWQRGNE